MRYAASVKLGIIRLVEESHLSARQALAKLGIPRTTFYRWYDRYLQRGEAGLQDQSPKPKHVWNRVPDEVKRKVVDLALQETELSPRELAVTFTDQERYFVSESTVYRTLKAYDLITSPALQFKLLLISRSSVYFALKGETTINLMLMRQIDEKFPAMAQLFADPATKRSSKRLPALTFQLPKHSTLSFS